jgi:cell division protein FtsI/penicillin-binding protein 2
MAIDRFTQPQQPDKLQKQSRQRVRYWYALLVIAFAVCFVRLFYLQVIRYDYYKAAAQTDQYKEYEIPASRGVIKAYDGDKIVPIVLSDELYTVYADPELVKDITKSAQAVQSVLGGDAAEYEKLMGYSGRYVVLEKKVTKQKRDKLLAKKMPGIGAQAQEYRTYPQGTMAAQLLGFVDDSGTGRYGVEQALNPILLGTSGELKAVTDVHGVPLAASTDNIRKQPVDGKDVILTIDIGMQAQVEKLLKAGLDRAKSESGSAVVLEVKTGAVKAMANWPSYNPSEYSKVEDEAVFTNMAVSDALEVGSVMKPLTVAAGLDKGVISPTSSFFDQRYIKIDNATVRNVEEDGGARQKDVRDILNLSLNTGATWVLMQMGGGELNRQGREVWHDYMTNHYLFGKGTGIEQGYEAIGTVPSPTEGFGLNITYANTSFGQAMTATMVQMAGAYAAVLNGGTYYQPHLVAATVDSDGKVHEIKPKAIARNVVAPGVSTKLQPMLEYVVDNHHFDRKFDDRYSVGGKTGTAQIANPAGGYYENEYNGTYVGFVGGDEAEYIIAVRVNKPKIPGYAGSKAAQPLFGDIAHTLIDSFNVSTKSQ